MRNWGDLSIMVLHMKLYDVIGKILEQKNINGYHKISIIDKLMKSDMKHTICKEMSNWIDNTKELVSVCNVDIDRNLLLTDN